MSGWQHEGSFLIQLPGSLQKLKENPQQMRRPTTSQHPEGCSFAADGHGLQQAYEVRVQTISTHDRMRKVTAVAFPLGEYAYVWKTEGILGCHFSSIIYPPLSPLKGPLTALRLAK